jgi:hypothetical protein
LADAIATEFASQKQLLSFAAEGDDAEVQGMFATLAEQARSHTDPLQKCLASSGGELEGKALTFCELELSSNTVEERFVHNLITAFCIQSAQCALYQALAQIAQQSGDTVTEQLARECQAARQNAAQTVFHFIPTRSKIAFNVLTADEIDPAVETKVGLS